MKKDILFVCQYFYPEYISSATLPFDTAKKLKQANFSVDALVGYPTEYNSKANVPLKGNVEGVGIKRIKYLNMSRTSKVGRIINYFSFTIAVLINIRKLRNYKSVIIYSNPPILPLIGVLAKKIFKNKLIFVSYDVYPEIAINTNMIGHSSLIAKVMRFINNTLFKNVDRVIALSNEMKNFLVENRRINSDKITVIPNWYDDKRDLELYGNSVSAEVKQLFKDNITYISYFGNMGIAQDFETLLSAIRKLKEREEIQFVFAGHGNKVSYLKEVISNESLKNVTILDFLHAEDYQYALQKSHVLLVTLNKGVSKLAVPSKTYSYMMVGKPIISIMDSDTDIAKDLKLNKAGFNVEIGDSEELTNKIKLLVRDQALQKECSLNSRKIFKEKYTTEVCTNKYISLFEVLLEEIIDVQR